MKQDYSGLWLLGFVAAVGLFGYLAQGYRDATATERCAKWENIRPFTDCELDKACALKHHSIERWQDARRWLSDTYDCP